MAILESTNANPKQPPEARFEQEAQSRLQSIRTLSIIIGILNGLGATGLLLLAAVQPAWQLTVPPILFALSATASFVAVQYLYPKVSGFAGSVLISVTFAIAITGTSAYLSNMGLPAAVVYLIFILMISSLQQKNWQANLLIGHGLIAAGCSALLTAFSPFEQLSIELIEIVSPAILGVLFMIYIVMLAMQFVTATLRVRLVTAFMAIVIIPLAILSLIQSRFMFNVLSDEVNRALQLAAQQTAFGIDRFMEESQRSVSEAAQFDIFTRYLSLPPDQRAGSTEETEMRLTLRVLDANELNSTVYLSSYALLERNGDVSFDTMGDRILSRFSPDSLRAMGIDVEAILQDETTNESGQDYFEVPLRSGSPFVSHLTVKNSTRGFFFVSAPVRSKETGEIIGVLRARYDGLLLQDLLKSYNGLLGSSSYAILLDDYNIRLADAYTPNFLYKSVAPLAQEDLKILKASRRLADLPAEMLATDFKDFDNILNSYSPKAPFFITQLSPGISTGDQGQIGAISAIRSMPWKVVYLRTDYNDEDLRSEQRRLTTLVTTLISVLVGFVAVAASQLLSSPIIRLTHTAQQVSQGNLEAQAPAESADEFGMLGAAFNSMTSQLRLLIEQLEERVRVRTKEIEDQNLALATRARQLQTISEVARQIVSSQELEGLLSSITQLVSERFGFYHVGVFLLEEKHEFAVLRAANSEGGQRMLARHHMLPVGKVGIVGYATGTGEPRIATDVGDDAVYFNNPDLPNTRSEMALPLKVGNQIIGALDIQSLHSNDFHMDDIELFTTLADQVAIAIYNNQLYVETVKALNEAQSLHRQYLRSEWTEDTARRKTLGYLFNQSGVAPLQTEDPLWKKVFNSGEPVYAVLPGASSAADKAVMAVPIAVRGETIGLIHVQDQGEDRLWSEDEIAVVNSIASQVAVALENARLFENTVRRAEREKKVLQITAKIRSTNDPEEMMQIAISELQQALQASRTQIYIRQGSDTTLDEGASHSNTNGRNSKSSAEKPSPEK